MENLNEQISRIRSMMGLINEEEKIIQNEYELIEFLKNNNFEKVEGPETEKKYKLEKYNGKYNWIYYNPKRRSFLIKFKDNYTMFGLQSKFDPKTQIKTSSDYKELKKYPLDTKEYEEFLFAPIIDESYDLESVIRDLNSIRNMYEGFIKKNEDGKTVFVESGALLNDNHLKVYKETIHERMSENMGYIENLSEEDKQKPVTSSDFNLNFSNILEYHKFVENETKNLGIY